MLSILAGVDGLTLVGFEGIALFVLSLEWVRSALAQGWRFIRQVVFTSNSDPDLAMASGFEHRLRSQWLEFQVCFFSYSPSGSFVSQSGLKHTFFTLKKFKAEEFKTLHLIFKKRGT